MKHQTFWSGYTSTAYYYEFIQKTAIDETARPDIHSLRVFGATMSTFAEAVDEWLTGLEMQQQRFNAYDVGNGIALLLPNLVKHEIAILDEQLANRYGKGNMHSSFWANVYDIAFDCDEATRFVYGDETADNDKWERFDRWRLEHKG